MHYNYIRTLFAVTLLSTPLVNHAVAPQEPSKAHPFYVGAAGGYGSTTWYGLVPESEQQNIAVNLSTPIAADEGGAVWGFFTGYELTPYFAFEANYLKLPDAKISFAQLSIFSINHNDTTEFTSSTETVNLMAKVMLKVPDTHVRVFSSAGIGEVHRKDILIDQWHAGPSFGFGFNYKMNDHFMTELNGNYTAGYGQSELEPTKVYIPFIYAVTFRLAYLI